MGCKGQSPRRNPCQSLSSTSFDTDPPVASPVDSMTPPGAYFSIWLTSKYSLCGSYYHNKRVTETLIAVECNWAAAGLLASLPTKTHHRHQSDDSSLVTHRSNLKLYTELVKQAHGDQERVTS